MLAAIESLTPPATDANQRALSVLGQGLALRPDSVGSCKPSTESCSPVAAPGRRSRSWNPRPSAIPTDLSSDSSPRSTASRELRQGRAHRAETVCRLPQRCSARHQPRPDDLPAGRAGRRAQRPRAERSLNEKTETLIHEFKAKFPDARAFSARNATWLRRGDLARLPAITEEMDKIGKNSPAGPLIRARIYSAQGRLREVAEAYSEALNRNPREPEVRVLLGQTRLKLGQTDEAIRQAQFVLELDHGQPDALLLQALAQREGTARQQEAQRAEAIQGSMRRSPRTPASRGLSCAGRIPNDAESADRRSPP